LENELAPILVLATNRGITTIRGTMYKSPHGIPVDLLDRMLIIPTQPYNDKEISEILKIRCLEEDVEIETDAMEMLSKIGISTSLRYAIHLITVASVIMVKRKGTKINKQDIVRVYELFVDVKRSAAFLQTHQNDFVFSEVLDGDDDGDDDECEGGDEESETKRMVE